MNENIHRIIDQIQLYADNERNSPTYTFPPIVCGPIHICVGEDRYVHHTTDMTTPPGENWKRMTHKEKLKYNPFYIRPIVQEYYRQWFDNFMPSSWNITINTNKNYFNDKFIGAAYQQVSLIFIQEILNLDTDINIAYILLHELGHIEGPMPNKAAYKMYNLLDTYVTKSFTRKERAYIFKEQYADIYAKKYLSKLISKQYIFI